MRALGGRQPDERAVGGDLDDRARAHVVGLGHEQPRGVAADVDHGGSGQGHGELLTPALLE
jgi:hypothetical protein